MAGLSVAKRFIGLLAMFAMLAGCRTTPAPTVVNGRTLRIATLNLYHDKDDWPRRRVQIIFNQADADGTWASDHYGVLATLDLHSRDAP